VPQPVATVPVEASRPYNDATLAEAQDAVRQAMLATGTEDPGEAGADFTHAAGAPVQVAAAQPPAPPPVKPAAAKPAFAKPPVTAPAPVAATSGPWKLQLGAFGVKGNAEKLWAQLSARPELQGKTRLLVPAGKLTKLLAGGFASRADANAACSRLQAAGQVCVVTQ
jgi:cell division septation protein DedD